MKKLPLFLFVAGVAFLIYALVFWKDGNIKIPLKKKSFSSKPKSASKNEFTKVVVDGVFDVDVSYGSKEKVEIEAPSYIKSRLKKKVKSKTLYFELDNGANLNAAGKVKVHISTATLNDFTISGASSVTLNTTLKDDQFSLSSIGAAHFEGKIDVETADIELNGGSTTDVHGSAESAHIKQAGASKMNDYTFEVDSLNVDLSGASSLKITCSQSLKGNVSGASSLNYKGDPKVKSVHVSGAGKIHQK